MVEPCKAIVDATWLPGKLIVPPASIPRLSTVITTPAEPVTLPPARIARFVTLPVKFVLAVTFTFPSVFRRKVPVVILPSSVEVKDRVSATSVPTVMVLFAVWGAMVVTPELATRLAPRSIESAVTATFPVDDVSAVEVVNDPEMVVMSPAMVFATPATVTPAVLPVLPIVRLETVEAKLIASRL